MTSPLLVIVPCAGASAAVYRKVRRSLEASFETSVYELPGRGARWREKPVSSWRHATRDLGRWLPKRRDLIIVGHSFGAYLAIGALFDCIGDDLSGRSKLLIASNCPPSRARGIMGERSSLRQSSGVLEIARRFGATSDHFPREQLLLDRATETLRADFLLAHDAIDNLQLPHPRCALNISVSVLLGENDPIATVPSDDWDAYFRQRVSVQTIAEVGHFFLVEAPEVAARTIVSTIEDYAAGR